MEGCETKAKEENNVFLAYFLCQTCMELNIEYDTNTIQNIIVNLSLSFFLSSTNLLPFILYFIVQLLC